MIEDVSSFTLGTKSGRLMLVGGRNTGVASCGAMPSDPDQGLELCCGGYIHVGIAGGGMIFGTDSSCGFI